MHDNPRTRRLLVRVYDKQEQTLVQKEREMSLNLKDPEAHRLAQAIAECVAVHVRRPTSIMPNFVYDENSLPK
jgi:hypothetical protein